MTRTVRRAALAAAVGILVATGAADRRQQVWHRRLWQAVTAEEAQRLLHLRGLGLLSAAEVSRVACLARGYDRGALVDAFSRVLLDDRPLTLRLAAKRALLTAVAAEIGPHVPRQPRPAATSRALGLI